MSALGIWAARDTSHTDYYREAERLSTLMRRALDRGQYGYAGELASLITRYRRVARMRAWRFGMPVERTRARNPSTIWDAMSPTDTQPSGTMLSGTRATSG